MSAVLNLTIPFFALIFLGMVCRGIGFVDQRDARMMAKYAFFIAMPRMVFVKIGAGSALDFLNWGFIWRYEPATALVFVLSALVARSLFSLSRLESGIFGLNAAYPNYGYIGVPLAILALGDRAALLSACLPVAANVFVLSDHYGGYSARGASAILMTTILASITVPIALHIIMTVV